MSKYSVYKDDEQWLPFFKWFWLPNPGITSRYIRKHPDPDNAGYGAFPAKWIAKVLGWVHTR